MPDQAVLVDEQKEARIDKKSVQTIYPCSEVQKSFATAL